MDGALPYHVERERDRTAGVLLVEILTVLFWTLYVKYAAMFVRHEYLYEVANMRLF